MKLKSSHWTVTRYDVIGPAEFVSIHDGKSSTLYRRRWGSIHAWVADKDVWASVDAEVYRAVALTTNAHVRKYGNGSYSNVHLSRKTGSTNPATRA